MTHRPWALLSALLALTVPAAGCLVTTEDPAPRQVVSPTEPPSSTSALVVTWTIDGLRDPNECIKSQSTNIDIAIMNAQGVVLAGYQEACTSFSTSITLNPGSYSAYAALIDASGVARTTDVGIAPFTLRGNDSLTIPVDFPADSFR